MVAETAMARFDGIDDDGERESQRLYTTVDGTSARLQLGDIVLHRDSTTCNFERGSVLPGGRRANI